MALFPHDHFDPIAYDRLPTDAEPELYFAPSPDQKFVEYYSKEIYGGVFFSVLLGGAFYLATQPSSMITIAAFLLAVVLVIYHAVHAGVHYCDILLLNKRLAPEAEQRLRESLGSKITVFACVKEFVFLATFLASYVILFILFPDSRLFNLSLIVIGFSTALIFYVVKALFNRKTRRVCTAVVELWFQVDYPREIPCAFQNVRIASQYRTLFSILAFALLAAFLPPLAYYFPVACAFKPATEISQFHSFPSELKKDAHVLREEYGIQKSSYQYLEETTAHVGELFEPSSSDSVSAKQKERAQELLNHIKDIRKFQNDRIQQSPTGWLVASFQMIQKETGIILISWLISFLACMLAVCIVFTAITLSVLSRIASEFETAVSQNLAFPTHWAGITHRLVSSADKYEQESLYLGTFGDE